MMNSQFCSLHENSEATSRYKSVKLITDRSADLEANLDIANTIHLT